MSLGPSSLARSLACAAGVALALSLPQGVAFAAGGGGGGGGGNGASSDMTTCPKGEVWSHRKHKCLKEQSGVLPDDELTDYAYALAKADRYAEAIGVLDLLKDPNTPKALNYRGYATRHVGKLDEGISYYLKSVALAPHYAKVREYLGEAYVIKGRLDLAGEQLKAIKAICGTHCEEYEDLSKAISNPSELEDG